MNIQETLQQKLGKEIAQASNEEIYGALLSMVQEMAGERNVQIVRKNFTIFLQSS